jgi:hypothetical protein
MSSASSSRVLVSHKYAEGGHLPGEGEIIIICLSQDLFGPGSVTVISSRNLPSRVNRPNYHHAVVLDINLEVFESAFAFTVLPMPSYSGIDPISELSSTR